jgi:hypothetical protein
MIASGVHSAVRGRRSMDIHSLIPGNALLIQLISVFFALRLMRYAEKRVIAVYRSLRYH